MIIVGISAKMGCGKTTLAEYIQDMIARSHIVGEGVPVLRAFGDPVKIETARTYGFPLAWAYSEEGKNRQVHGGEGKRRTVRELLQYHGTDVRRAQDKDYWIKAMDEYVAMDMHQKNHILAHDVRFPNEARWILDHGGLLLRLEPYPGWQPGPYAEHESEKALDNFQGWHMELRPEFGQLFVEARRVMKAVEGFL